MRLVRNIILFIVALYIGAVVFMPKSQLYYFGEKQLKKYGVVIDKEELNEKVGTLEVAHSVVVWQGLEIARVSNLKFSPLLFVNKVSADSVELMNSAKKFMNIQIDTLKANNSILKPYIVKIDAVGSFGVANGYADMKNRTIHIDIIKAKDLVSLKRYLNKGEKGWYYESKF